MKPCDCRSMQDVYSLQEQGLGFNNYKISVDSNGVFLDIDPYVRIKIHHSKFKSFAEWYLEDQLPNKIDSVDACYDADLEMVGDDAFFFDGDIGNK